MVRRAIPALLLLAAAAPAASPRDGDATIEVDCAKTGPVVPPSLIGIFFEEINHAGDGGIYAELVQNRSFEETLPPEGTTLRDGHAVAPPGPHYLTGRDKEWRVRWDFRSPHPAWTLAATGGASMTVEGEVPLNGNNPRYLHVRLDAKPAPGAVRILNDGYWGIAVQAGKRYSLSFFARTAGGYAGGVAAGLVAPDGTVLARAVIPDVASAAWRRHAAVLKADGTHPKARLFLEPSSAGSLCVDVVSLFPEETFRGRPNGLRADIAQLLADLKPAFVRFPGGCYVEGATWENRYAWKKTIGPIEERPGHWCLWNYRSTDGLGFHEYLQLCEDIGADALYVANCGLSCEFRHGSFLPEERLGEQIQDALDAIEYALGPVTSAWGAKRAANGHPAPFPLRYVQIGNENHGPRYKAYYRRFYEALKAKHPKLKLVLCCGCGWATPDMVEGVGPVEIADEHFYRNPDWFFNEHRRYDAVPRDRGFEVYVGEYACNQGVGRGNLLAALSEAAFLLGMERNSDVVTMTSYAPLLFNVNRLDWPVNLIGYDSATAFGRSSYHVQKLFSLHRPDTNLAVTCEARAPADAPPRFAGFIGLGTWNGQAEYKDIRIEREGKVLYASDFDKTTAGWTPCWGRWEAVDGAYRQSEAGERKIALYEGARLEEYVLTLKARKLSGAEGFLLQFGAADRDNYHQLNLGGWGNRAHAFERIQGGRQATVSPETPGRIEAGRWYEIRLVVRRDAAEGYLDGKPVAALHGASGVRFYAGAGLDRKAKDIILKIVNAEERPMTASVELKHATVKAEGRTITLAGNPREENDVDRPGRIVPVEAAVEGIRPSFKMTFPPSSLTILRVGMR